MSQIKLIQGTNANTADSAWKSLCKIGAAAALMQLACTLILIIVSFTLGLKPSTAEEYFTIFQNDRLVGLLRDDFSSLIIIALYLGTFPGLYAALRRVNGVYAAFATALVFVGVTSSFGMVPCAVI
jgi:hypothetical protein